MRRSLLAGITACVVTGAVLSAQQPARPMSADGSAQAQVFGKWTKGERPAFTLGRENYVGGKWIEPWSFLDMTNDGGRIALMWGKTIASASFKATS